MSSITYQVIKGLKDGRDSNYFLVVFAIMQIHGTLFFDKSLLKLMQVCHNL